MKGRITATYITLFCVYLTAVGVLCFIKPSSIPEIDIKTFLGIPIDKILHFLMFLPYPILAGPVFVRRERGFASGILTLALLAVTGAGVAYGTEVIQAHTGYRSYEIADFHADITGIITGSLIAMGYLTYTRLK